MSSERSSLISNVRSNETELQVYSIRWILVLVIGLQFIIMITTGSSFGVINDVIANYFQISYIAVNWIQVVALPGTMIGTLFLIFRVLLKSFYLRKLSITSCAISICSFVLLFISFAFRDFFPVIYLGQFLIGVNISFYKSMINEIAKVWFPENEVGKALAVFPASRAMGALLGLAIPSHIVHFQKLNNVKFNKNITCNYCNNHTTAHNESIKLELYLMFAPLFCLSLVVCFAFLLISNDQPPKPPSLAQAQIRRIQEEAKSSTNGRVDITTFRQEIVTLLSSETILCMSVVNGTLISVNVFFVIFFTQGFRTLLTKLTIDMDPDVLSSYVLLSSEGVRFLAGLLSGVFLDRFQRLKLQLSLALTFGLTSSLGLIFVYVYENLVGVYIFSSAIGFSVGYAMIFPYEISYRNLHPLKPEKIFPFIDFPAFFVCLMESLVYSLLLNYVSNVSGYIFMSLMFVVNLVLLFIVKINSNNPNIT